jgi:hypothetical protein
MPVETQKLAASPPKETNNHDPVYLKIRDLVYQACVSAGADRDAVERMDF